MRLNRWMLAGVGALMIAQASVAMAGSIPWTSNWTAAQADARRTGRLIMVDFFADWSLYSENLDNQVFPDASVVKAAAQFVPIRLNADAQGRQLAQKYGVTDFPTIAFVDAAGNFVDKIVGFEPAPAFAKELDRIEQDAKEFPLLQRRVKADPKDTPAAARLAIDLIQRGRIDEAETLIRSMETRGAAHPELALTYQRMGDYYLDADRVKSAAPWYRKVLSVTSEPAEVSSAHFKLGVCDIVMKNTEAGEAEMKSVVDNPGAPAALKDQAKQVLLQLKKKKS
ncbi:MAG TPA: thioredoxin fold domain-containing protein [Armatimonadota bacterium]|nr:thioredoxin fold domain-containing protein [Armatimonadota bacterium]